MNKPTPFSLALGERIRSRREALALDRMDFAHALGAHYMTVGGWERGAVQPSAPQLVRLAGVLGVTVDWILGVAAPEPRP